MAAIRKSVASETLQGDDVPSPQSEHTGTDRPTTEGSVELSRYLSFPSAAEAQGTLRFDPGASYAVVSGVGKQLCPEAGVTDLGTTADGDATLISSILTGTFEIPQKQVTVLNSRTQPGATSTAIKTALSSYSSNVGEHGVLVVYFSGHCIMTKHDDKVFLAPADFKRTINTIIAPIDIVKALENCTGYMILILDCCYAGLFAERLITEAERSGLKVCVLASCAGEEKSLSHNELGNCFFTYFLASFLRDVDGKRTDGMTSEFPVEESVEYCRPLCEAMLSLMRPGYGDSAKMTPAVTFSSLATIQMILDDAGEDVPDGQQSRQAFALKYLTHNMNEGRLCDLPDVPQSVRAWLREDATEAFQRLHRAGALGKHEVYVTVLGMTSQSIAQIMFEDKNTSTSNRSVILQPDLFIFCFFRLSEVLLHISPDLVPDLCYMEHCLEHYMKKVHDLTQADVEGEEFRDFISLLTRVVSDLNRQGVRLVRARRTSVETGTDAVDGHTENPTVEDIIRSLPPSEVERIYTVELLED
ncbi:Hypp5907 [Branchiostoma lanceolatum]|uniref:Hypp5907 protein n=1 Tax=Branchiostoma lanceolatum TaxID=7740 RepID=A0A8J9W5C5_BRALA|nr:Hypp5907 [Branchiostoma lanceolatum]